MSTNWAWKWSVKPNSKPKSLYINRCWLTVMIDYYRIIRWYWSHLQALFTAFFKVWTWLIAWNCFSLSGNNTKPQTQSWVWVLWLIKATNSNRIFQEKERGMRITQQKEQVEQRGRDMRSWRIVHFKRRSSYLSLSRKWKLGSGLRQVVLALLTLSKDGCRSLRHQNTTASR